MKAQGRRPWELGTGIEAFTGSSWSSWSHSINVELAVAGLLQLAAAVALY